MLVAGATDTFYVATESGNYNIEVTNEYGCKQGAGINFTVGITELSIINYQLSIIPNPTTGIVSVLYHLNSDKGTLQLFDLLGKQVGEFQLDGKNEKFDFDIGNLCCGVFEYRLLENNISAGYGKLVIIR